MDWIVAWEQAQRNLSEASKLYDRVRMLPPPTRRAIGPQEYADRRRQAFENYKMADQACIKLKQLTRRSRYNLRTQDMT